MGDAAAFFDMDHTITWENSGLSFVRFAGAKGIIPTGHVLKSMFKIVLYRLSLLNIEHWYEKNMEMLSGTKLQDMDNFCTAWFEETLKKAIYKEALDLIRGHKEKGRRVVIISNSPIFFVKPMAHVLQIPDVICSRVEIKNGILTGKLVKPLCYGEGKKFYAQVWAEENGVDLARSYFYTDSSFDVALMKVVGYPIATNPDMKLRKAALESHWPILDFKKQSAF